MGLNIRRDKSAFTLSVFSICSFCRAHICHHVTQTFPKRSHKLKHSYTTEHLRKSLFCGRPFRLCSNAFQTLEADLRGAAMRRGPDQRRPNPGEDRLSKLSHFCRQNRRHLRSCHQGALHRTGPEFLSLIGKSPYKDPV